MINQSLFSSPAVYRRVVLSMANATAENAEAAQWASWRARWPGTDNLKPREITVHTAWNVLSSTTRVNELSKVTGWVHPGPPFTKVEQCRDLVISQRKLPNVKSRIQPSPLTDEELRLLLATLPPTQASAPVSAPPPTEEHGVSLADFRRLQIQLLDQRAEIEALKDNQGGDDEAKSTYEVGFSSLALLPEEGKGSWTSLPMMTSKERKRLLREHTGTFEIFPKDLELKEVFGDYPAVKALKINFSAFVKEDMARALTMNKGTIQALLTIHSKLEELNMELLSVAVEDEDGVVDENATVNAQDMREKIGLLLDNCEGGAKLALDAHAGLRLSVSNKVMQSIGAKHLTKQPNDKEKDDFISKDAAEKIMERAELKEGVRIATDANSGFFGTPSRKSKGNGGKGRGGRRLSNGFQTPKSKTKTHTGRGAGGGKGRGKGGRGKDTGTGRGSGSTGSSTTST